MRTRGTIVYVDAFNLYYGALKDSRFKWLDLDSLAKRLLPRDQTVAIRYFYGQHECQTWRPGSTAAAADISSGAGDDPAPLDPSGSLLDARNADGVGPPRTRRAGHGGSHQDRREGLRREPGDASDAGRLPRRLHHSGGDFERFGPSGTGSDGSERVRVGRWSGEPPSAKQTKSDSPADLLQAASPLDPQGVPVPARDDRWTRSLREAFQLVGVRKRRDPPKRVSHPATEATGGVPESYRNHRLMFLLSGGRAQTSTDSTPQSARFGH